MVRDDGHVLALERAAMAAATSAVPHRSKVRIPPGPDAVAAADALRQKTSSTSTDAAAAVDGVGSGWDTDLGAVRDGAGGRRHRGPLQGQDVTVVADHRPGTYGGEAVAGQHHRDRVLTGSGDLQVTGAEPDTPDHGGPGQLGSHRVEVAGVGDQGLGACLLYTSDAADDL